MTVEQCNDRMTRAMATPWEIGETDSGTYWIYNPDTAGFYTVRNGRCNCPDYLYRCWQDDAPCKHVIAVEAWAEEREDTSSADVTADEEVTASPDPEWIVGDCPECGGPVVQNVYYRGGRGIEVYRECWLALTGPDRPPANCHYRGILVGADRT